MAETCAICGHWRGVHNYENEACPIRWDALGEPVEWSKDAVFHAPPSSPGANTPYTPEPWEANGHTVIASKATFRALFDCKPLRMTLPAAECAANARRIAACVNACKGLPTEMLELSVGCLNRIEEENAGLRALVLELVDGIHADEYDGWLARARKLLGLEEHPYIVKDNREELKGRMKP